MGNNPAQHQQYADYLGGGFAAARNAQQQEPLTGVQIRGFHGLRLLHVIVDGQPVGIGPNLALNPGKHDVSVFLKCFFVFRRGKASIVVDVSQGQTTILRYRAPFKGWLSSLGLLLFGFRGRVEIEQ